MKLSEELIWRGFQAETTIKDPAALDNRENKQFYWGADPSADSLTIGNLAALMMCACFVRHGYKPYLLVGGATGQIGDPKDTGERELKSLEEVEHNKQCIREQIERVISADNVTMLDNLDWFRDMRYLDFLRTIGKSFSMTQLMDRKFIQSRMGEGGSGISYAEFSYTLIQGYDFYHLYKTYGIDLQLCGADQYGNCSTGISLIRKLENASADVWSTPLVIDPASGRKFGKSEGNAVWLASTDNGQGNYTTIFDFYQFWLSQPDQSVEYLLKIYTIYDRPEIEQILREHAEHPEQRIAQRALAKGATAVVHGADAARIAEQMTSKLFSREEQAYSDVEIADFATILPSAPLGINIVEDLVDTSLASSKGEARKLIGSGAVSVNGRKITDETYTITAPSVLKRGKNKFAVVK